MGAMRLFPLLLLAFTVLPVVELMLLIRIGQAIHLGPTLLLVVTTGVVGAALARWQGLRTLRQIQEQLAQGGVPTRELFDGALILVAGAVLVTPGVITDAAGFALLVPPVRSLLARLARRWAQGRVQVTGVGAGAPGRRGPRPARGAGDVIDVTGTVRDATPEEAAALPGRDSEER